MNDGFVFSGTQPFLSCHASTLVEAEDGTLLCSWFGGTREKNPDTAIWLSRLVGEAWSPPERVADIGMVAHWNPVLFRDDAFGTFLFFKVGDSPNSWSTYWMKTDDCGATWSKPVELVEGEPNGRGPVKNKPIVLSDGAWLAPASDELGRITDWHSFADRSEDGGFTWFRSEYFVPGIAVPKTCRAIQPTFWEAEPGLVTAFMRTADGFIAACHSSDFGCTWGPMHNTGLPSNNSGFDAVKLADGRVILAYNPVSGDWAARVPLVLAESVDGGHQWKVFKILEGEGPAKPGYAYPSIVATSSGFAVSYTWQRKRIRVRAFRLK